MLLVSLPNRPYRYRQQQQPEPAMSESIPDTPPSSPPPPKPRVTEEETGVPDPTRYESAKRRHRPGAILVRSRPSPAAAPDFTSRDLTRWYEHKHIPEVLATSGVRFAVRYQLQPPPQQLPEQQPPKLGRAGTKRKRRRGTGGGGGTGGEGAGAGGKRKRADKPGNSPSGQGADNKPTSAGDAEEGSRSRDQTASQSPSVETQLPFLAVYWLADMDWLHQDGCPFWGVSLALDDEKSDEPLGRGDGGVEDPREEKRGRSVVEVAEFEAGFWEVVGQVEFGKDGRKGATGLAGSAKHLVLMYLDAEQGDGKDAETLLRISWPEVAAARRVRSTLFRIDATRPCPPAARGLQEEGGIRPSEKNYLCMYEVWGDGSNITAVLGEGALNYTLLSIFGERQHFEKEISS